MMVAEMNMSSYIIHWIIIQMYDKSYIILTTLYRLLCTIMYWSRSQSVPAIGDPILRMSATELAEHIRDGKLSSEQVVKTYITRIMEVEPIINALADSRFQDALIEAKHVDGLISSGVLSPEKMAREKPLLGVPFTVKSLLMVEGMRCTAGGSLVFKDHKATIDAPTVKLLKDAGGILIATSNAAEMGLHLETSNYVYGVTCNPYDTSKTSGGSSGGESALLAAAGSVIGLGNDIAGSIRIPCMFTGIFGHKPTRGLVSNDGCFPPGNKEAWFLMNAGPMCRYATDLVTMMQVLSLQGNAKSRLKQEVDFSKLKVYYITTFGKILLTEDVEEEVQNAVIKVSSFFENKYKCDVKKAQIPLLKQSKKIYMHRLLSAIPSIGKTITVGKEDPDAKLEALKFLFRQSKYTIGPIIAFNIKNAPLLYSPNKIEHYRKLERELEEEFDKILDDNSILVLPTLPFAATYHNEMALKCPSTCYTSVFNVLGLPVTQCPVAINKQGLPIGVQIVGKKGNDALTIACSIELEKAFGGWKPPR